MSAAELLREARDKLKEASSPYIPSCAEDEQWCKWRDDLCDRIDAHLASGGRPSHATLRCRKCGDNYDVAFHYSLAQPLPSLPKETK